MTARTRTKICGVTTPEIARCAVEAGADAVGIVLAPGSPRTVDLQTAGVIAAAVPPFVAVVLVLRNPDPAALDAARVALPDATIQLHGDEDETLVRRAGSPVIRGLAFDPAVLRRWDACTSVAALLVDGPAPGSGRAFDHAALAALMPELTKPVVLAGGLAPDTVAAAVARVHPYAVDVSSGVESAPGVKDPALVEAFCAAVREAA